MTHLSMLREASSPPRPPATPRKLHADLRCVAANDKNGFQRSKQSIGFLRRNHTFRVSLSSQSLCVHLNNAHLQLNSLSKHPLVYLHVIRTTRRRLGAHLITLPA